MLSDTSPVSASAARLGSARLCHLVCSTVCCIRPQLKSTTVFRVCRNCLCWWEVYLIVNMYSNSPLLWEPLCHPGVYLCGCTEYHSALSLVVLADRSYIVYFLEKFVYLLGGHCEKIQKSG